MKEVKEAGAQPLDTLMTGLGVKNADLVSASTEQLTHKVIQKGRRGRRLTLNAKSKILRALNTLNPEKQYTLKELFNYD